MMSEQREHHRPSDDDAVAWRRAVLLFDTGEYWETHEVLENVWMTKQGPEREFLGGVILLAATLHKMHLQDNAPAARRLYARALYRLARLPDYYWGVDLRRLERLVMSAMADPEANPKIPWIQDTYDSEHNEQ